MGGDLPVEFDGRDYSFGDESDLRSDQSPTRAVFFLVDQSASFLVKGVICLSPDLKDERDRRAVCFLQPKLEAASSRIICNTIYTRLGSYRMMMYLIL